MGENEIIEDTTELLVACLKALGLELKEVFAIFSILKTENQKLEMLAWIKENHEKNPSKTKVIMEAIAIMEEITD